MKRVRLLCDNGITKVPRKYVLPLPDRPQLTPAARKPSLKLPVIDVGQLLLPDRTEVLETLDRACKEYGFFQMVNHSIAGEVTRRMIDVGKRFFELRFEERAKYMKTDDELEGLQVLHRGEWITVEPLPNSVIVNVGDHLEIHSNRRYKIVLHRALVNTSKSRLSMASLHGLSFDRVVHPSPELVDKDHPRLYKDTD
ncbi:hypothetical protein C4D60_Mb04t04400 [Musa balbisiana]|uniref:Non-haem dioxygenase N-terminal domain-containing protein n=1 Tax=Musa balbisiana TaxID=52838 RepID=A0A4S8K9K4_MUSBA|nr:hypothetical protein C4D60_Mb04t04400 [Musa balbisiana]